MTENRKQKKLARELQAATGKPYTAALRALREAPMLKCGHREFNEGRCAEMICGNYYNANRAED